MTAIPNAYDKGRSIVANIQRGAFPGGRFSDVTKNAAYERGRRIALRALGKIDVTQSSRTTPAARDEISAQRRAVELAGSVAQPDLTFGSLPVRLVARCADSHADSRIVIAFLGPSGEPTGRRTKAYATDVRGVELAKLDEIIAALPLEGRDVPRTPG